MKDKVLSFLIEQSDYISGEEISQNLGVTRACIWKAVKKLQDEGYVIESSTRKGYKLIERPNVITSLEVREIISSKIFGKHIEYFNAVNSTNEKAKELATNGAVEGTVILADKQVSGKGRLGRGWSSPSKTGIWMSVILKPCILPQSASQITLIAGLCMCEAIQAVTGLEAKIKWPNDIVVNGKKVCGILTEMSAEIERINYIVLGIGVNVNQKAFPEYLPYATSLMIEGKKEYQRKYIIKDFLERFEKAYAAFCETENLVAILERYERNCITLGKSVKIIEQKGEYIAQAIGITSDGSLQIVTQEGEERTVVSGEVSVRGLYGYI